MLNKYKERYPDAKWIVLHIDPIVLLHADALFYESNAASSKFKNISEKDLSSTDALINLFSNKIVTKDRFSVREYNSLPNATTDEQAEIMVKDIVPKEYILNWSHL